MVEHLDELRSRLIICLLVLGVAFVGCFVFNHTLISLLNRALPKTPQHGLAALQKQTAKERRGLDSVERALGQLAQSTDLSAQDRASFALAQKGIQQTARSLPSSYPTQEKPITIGVGEPFMTTLAVAAYFALLFALPVLIYQIYAFVLPALSPDEKRVALPVMMAAPLLFLLGVLFAYLFVLPPAVHFLQGYNSNEFQILVGAGTYYKFEIFTMLGIGVAFQMPLGLLGLHAVGAVNGTTLTRHWRYAVVGIAVIAAAMPGADPVTTALETAPLVVLYLASIVLLKLADRRAAARAAQDPTVAFDDGVL